MFTRFLAAAEPALWTIACGGRIEGCLVREAGLWRLSWFDGADRRLTSYAGPVGGARGATWPSGRTAGSPVLNGS